MNVIAPSVSVLPITNRCDVRHFGPWLRWVNFNQITTQEVANEPAFV
jgi:hypothetical protein